MNIVVVNFSYRVGPYSFLASREVQAKVLQWVQSYVALFGGDPSHVTIGVASAGSQSVDLHVTAYNGRNDGLFHATAAESQSFSALRTVEESQFSYDHLVIRTGCASANDTLVCLRSLSAATVQKKKYSTPFSRAQDVPLFMYGLLLDFDFVTDCTYRAYAEGKFVRVPALAGDDTNEGTVFTNISTNSTGRAIPFSRASFRS